MEHIVTLHTELPANEAWALAQLLKRIGFSDCRALAEDEAQAYRMLHASRAGAPRVSRGRVRATLATGRLVPPLWACAAKPQAPARRVPRGLEGLAPAHPQAGR